MHAVFGRAKTAPSIAAGGRDPAIGYAYDQASRLTEVRGGAYRTAVLASNPIAYWRLGEASGTTVADSSGNARTTTAGPLGRWSVFLPAGAAGGPFDLTVKGTPSTGAPGPQDSVTMSDVLVGDLWLASGQSNMEFEMRKAATADQDLPHAANPNIRLLIVKKIAAEYPKDDIETDGWAASTPETARDFSAVAWYFARVYPYTTARDTSRCCPL